MNSSTFVLLGALAPAIIVHAAASEADTRTINIMSGTYGQSCGTPHRDVTQDLARDCDGRLTCNYVLDGTVAADTPSCHRRFSVQWLCGNAEVHTAFLDAGPRSGDTLVLSCKPENGPGK